MTLFIQNRFYPRYTNDGNILQFLGSLIQLPPLLFFSFLTCTIKHNLFSSIILDIKAKGGELGFKNSRGLDEPASP
jgi:hypothetical protein